MDPDDDDGIHREATNYVRFLGRVAVEHLIERAASAEALGDLESGKTWREIALAAGDLIKRMPE
jgi:hypothetical protein